ncbi:MAG: patatin-like phospholipase family protein [Atribacterota bacterium]|nr:patatin-like phospholipase family protein [Atribacterota bacterium]
MSEKFGLVLEGGGAKGAYEIGACEAIFEMGIEISAVAGTSVGALNGAMIAQHAIKEAHDLWYNISPSQIMNIDEGKLKQLASLEIKPGDMSYFLKMFGELISEGGIDVSPLKRLIKKHVNEDKLRKSHIDLGMVTVSFSDRKAIEVFVEDIPYGQVADYLFASANFPLFRTAKIGDKIFLDGGIYDNLPINMLLKKGFKSLITIQVGGLGRKRKVDLSNLNIINIESRENLGGPLNFDSEKTRKNLKLGYYDAYRVVKSLTGNLYYINLAGQEDSFVDYFKNLDLAIISKIAKVLNLKENIPPKRLLFERVIPKLIDVLKLPADCKYQDIAIALAERIALQVDVERFQIYSFQEFIEQIIKNYKTGKTKATKENNLISHFGFLSLFSSDNVLKKIVDELLNEKLMKSLHKMT